MRMFQRRKPYEPRLEGRKAGSEYRCCEYRVGAQHFLHGDDESDRGVQKMK